MSIIYSSESLKSPKLVGSCFGGWHLGLPGLAAGLKLTHKSAMSVIQINMQARQVIKSAVYLCVTLVGCVIYSFLIVACFRVSGHGDYFHSWDSGFEMKLLLVINLPFIIGTVSSLILIFWLLFKVIFRKWPISYLLTVPVYILIWFTFTCIMGGQSMAYFN